MTERFTLDGGGQLTTQQDGMLVRCEATRPNDGRGIYKVWLAGAAGTVLLGTLAPEGDTLRLCRRVSRDSLERAGCWPIEGGRCVLAFSFQRSQWAVEPAERRMTDPVLRRSAQGMSALVHEEEDGFRMALPFDCTHPFGLVPAFCFARVEPVRGQMCAVFAFDRQGRPLMQD